LSPDSRRVAVAGFGVKTGLVVILNRTTRAVEHALPEVTSPHVVWSIAFTPSGKRVVYGTAGGEVFVWDFSGKAPKATLFAGSGGNKVNRVKLVAFLDSRRFVSVAQDGKVLIRDVRHPRAAPRQVGKFELPNLYDVVISPDRQTLAACGENVS